MINSDALKTKVPETFAELDGPESQPRVFGQDPPAPPESVRGLRMVTFSPGGGTRGGFLDPYIGATIDGRYEVESQLGEGGMGVVYRGLHNIIGKRVAIKILRADLARNDEVVERFLNEARSASSIGNPHIIDISDFGRLPDGATYFVMEYLEGHPLSAFLDADKLLDPERIGHVMIQLSEALAAARAAGIVHRDLKPDNIFLIKRGSQEDFVKVLDFGIAKATSTGSRLTQAGQVFGTPHYMAPEQAAGAVVDHRADIYATGVMLYELLTSRLPFDAENFMGILTQHMYKEPPAPNNLPGLVRPIAKELEAVILKCLRKAPAERYQSMGELGDDLRAIFGDVPAGSYPELRVSQLGRIRESTTAISPKKRRRGIRFLAPPLLGLIAAVAWAIWSGQLHLLPEQSPPQATGADAPSAVVSSKQTETARPLRTVVLGISPIAAHAFLGDRDLGPSPIVLEVADAPVEIEVRAPGYLSERLSVDGTQARLAIELTPADQAGSPAQARPVRQAPTATRTPEAGLDGDLVPASPGVAKSAPAAGRQPLRSTTKPPRKPHDAGIVDPWGD